MYEEMTKELIQPATWHYTSSKHLCVIMPLLKLPVLQTGIPICQLPNLPQPSTEMNTSNNVNLST